MSDDPTTPVVYDTGALLAAQRHDRRMQTFHKDAMISGRPIVVPAPVLTQVWCGGKRQAGLAMLLRACVIEPTSEQIAKAAGVLLGASGTSDAVDAIVVATALQLGAYVITSDPDDLNKLVDAASAPLRLIVV